MIQTRSIAWFAMVVALTVALSGCFGGGGATMDSNDGMTDDGSGTTDDDGMTDDGSGTTDDDGMTDDGSGTTDDDGMTDDGSGTTDDDGMTDDGSGTTDDDDITSQEPTPPVSVAIEGFPGSNIGPISSIHLEMTDFVDIVKPNSRSTHPYIDSQLDLTINEQRRGEVVCPGVRPRGNECTIPTAEVDGVEYTYSSPADVSIGLHVQSLNNMRVLYPGPINGVKTFLGLSNVIDAFGDHFEYYGGWGEYSAFYTATYDSVSAYRSYSVAFGELYEGRPTAEQGSATWQGAMVGTNIADSVQVNGASLLEYDFSNDTLDLMLSSISASRSGTTYNGPTQFEWTGLQQNNDGSFYIRGHGNDRQGTDPHPEFGYVDGDFYGPGAEEFAGVFERGGVTGAFGGRRQQ